MTAADEKSNAIRLDQFLKLNGVAGTGGQAKWMIQDGQVTVNGTLETRRGRKLQAGDVVAAGGRTFTAETG